MSSASSVFLIEIDRFLARTATDPTSLGKQALGDPNFVFDLRQGRSPSTRTIDKVRNWMTAQTPKTKAAISADRLTHPSTSSAKLRLNVKSQ
jgi:hypothetical protein